MYAIIQYSEHLFLFPTYIQNKQKLYIKYLVWYLMGSVVLQNVKLAKEALTLIYSATVFKFNNGGHV